MGRKPRGYKDTYPNQLPLTEGNSRLEQSSACHTRTDSRAWPLGWGEPNHISSKYLSASHTCSDSFPTKEVTFHVSIASLDSRGLVHQGLHHCPYRQCTQPPQRLLECGAGPHERRHQALSLKPLFPDLAPGWGPSNPPPPTRGQSPSTT